MADHIGCVLDISASPREATKKGSSQRLAIDQLDKQIQEAVSIGQAEHQRNPNAFMFVALCGSESYSTTPALPFINLCKVSAQILIGGTTTTSTGYELLVDEAKQCGFDHLSHYLRGRFTNLEAYFLASRLQHHPEFRSDIIAALPGWRMERIVDTLRGLVVFGTIYWSIRYADAVAEALFGSSWDYAKIAIFAGLASICSQYTCKHLENYYLIERSKAMRMARAACDDWSSNLSTLGCQPIAQILDALQQLHGHMAMMRAPPVTDTRSGSVLYRLVRRYVHGDATTAATVTQAGTQQLLGAFPKQTGFSHRCRLILISDDKTSKMAHQMAHAHEFQHEGVEVEISTAKE